MRRVDINQVPLGDRNGNGVADRLEYVRCGGDGDGSVRPYVTGDNNPSTSGATTAPPSTTRSRPSSTRASDGLAGPGVLHLVALRGRRPAQQQRRQQPVQATDAADLGLDWGNAGLHREHVFNTSAIWNAPTFENRAVFRARARQLVDGGIVFYSSGVPLTV